MQRLEELKQRKAAAVGQGEGAGEEEGPSAAAVVMEEVLGLQGLGGAMADSIGQGVQKRKRVIDTLNELMAVGEGSGEDSDEEEGGGGSLLDWRAKGV